MNRLGLYAIVNPAIFMPDDLVAEILLNAHHVEARVVAGGVELRFFEPAPGHSRVLDCDDADRLADQLSRCLMDRDAREFRTALVVASGRARRAA